MPCILVVSARKGDPCIFFLDLPFLFFYFYFLKKSLNVKSPQITWRIRPPLPKVLVPLDVYFHHCTYCVILSLFTHLCGPNGSLIWISSVPSSSGMVNKYLLKYIDQGYRTEKRCSFSLLNISLSSAFHEELPCNPPYPPLTLLSQALSRQFTDCWHCL